MKNFRGLVWGLVLSFALVALAGCSGDSDDVGLVPDITGESIGGEAMVYEKGAAVYAVSYAESADISLYLRTASAAEDEVAAEEVAFVEVHDGDFVGSGLRTFGVKLEGGVSDDFIVNVSNGGGYYTEAIADGSGYYVCEFGVLADNLYQPILVEVVYADGRASKEKFVVATQVMPARDELVREGVALMIGADILDDQALKDALGPILSADDMLGMDTVVKKITPDTEGNGIIHLELSIDLIAGGGRTGLNADIILQDEADGTRGLYLVLEDGRLDLLEDGTSIPLPDRLLNLIADLGNLGTIAFPLDLGELLAELDLGLELDLARYLFIDLYGMPEYNSANFAVVGGGLYSAHNEDVETDAEGNALAWPAIDVYDAPLKWEIQDPSGNVGAVISQYNLTQVLNDILGGVELVLDCDMELDGAALKDQLPFLIPAEADGVQEIKATVKPGSIEMNLLSDDIRVVVSDLRLEYLEAGQPVWEISVDLSVVLGLYFYNVGQDLMLDLDLIVQETHTHTHIMKTDIPKLGMYDHSYLIEGIVDTLLGGNTNIASLNLTELLGEYATLNAASVGCSRGYLYLDAAIGDLKLADLLSGLLAEE